jgi:hypothetical protein
MHKAWRRAVGKLADCVLEKLELLRREGQAWQSYIETGRAAGSPPHRGRAERSQAGVDAEARDPLLIGRHPLRR